jgi:hypothetical protein
VRALASGLTERELSILIDLLAKLADGPHVRVAATMEEGLQ